MTRTLNVQSLLTRRALVVLVMAASATLCTVQNAQAQSVGTGTISGAVCEPATPPPPPTPPPHNIPGPPGTGSSHGSNSQTNGSNQSAAQTATADATAQFVTLTGKAVAEGFDNTSSAIKLSQDSSGTAGAIININYTSEVPTNTFYGFRFKYKGNGSGVKKSTTIKYCFQSQKGTGSVVTYSTTLDKMRAAGTTNGFNLVAMFNNDPGFGGLNVENFVLRKVVISLTDPKAANNLTIGYIQVDTGKATPTGNVIPANENMNLADCNALFACPTGPNVQ